MVEQETLNVVRVLAGAIQTLAVVACSVAVPVTWFRVGRRAVNSL
ncbi:hypothetical protein ACFP81_14570 [Deinococcus lacus]